MHPSARGSGVGRALLGNAVGRARSAGCAALALDVDVANVRARALYERLGLAVVSTSARAVLLGGTRVHRMSAPLAALTPTA